jgi:hypothetical protein
MRKQLLALCFGLVVSGSVVEAESVTPSQSSLGASTVAYVAQPDSHHETSGRVNNAAGSTSKPSRLLHRETPTSRSGSNYALVGYLAGESLTELASDLTLHDKDQARDLVHQQMISVHQRYLHDHAALDGRLHANLLAPTRDDVLSHYARGESLETIAAELNLYGPNDAREIVREALSALSRRLRRAR